MLRFGFIGDILRWLLDLIYSMIPNYGIAILIFVLIIRVCLMPLEVKSRRGMKRMQEVQPLMDAINKKYANDKERLNQKMSDLYKKEKVNPMAGCLPMLLTMPILFAMYGALRYMANEQLVQQTFNLILTGETAFEPFLWVKNLWMPDSPFSGVWPNLTSLQMVEEKQWLTVFNSLGADQIATLAAKLNISDLSAASFAKGEALTSTINAIVPLLPVAQESSFLRINLLITELVVVDNFNGLFILPILSAVSQFVMSKLTEQKNPQPAPAANGQQQPNSGAFMKWFFPLFSLWICASSNAAFALYWVVTNLFSLVSNQIINWKLDNDEKKAAENPAAAAVKSGLK